MTANQPVHGTLWQRIAIRTFTVLLGLLFFWLLGFVVQDVGQLEGPKFEDFRTQYVDAPLTNRLVALRREVADLDKELARQRERRELVGESSAGLQNTIDQLIELQKLSLERGQSPGDSKEQTFSETFDLFLANQERYQGINQVMAALADKRSTRQEEVDGLVEQIAELEKPAREEFDDAREKHNFRIAGYKLAVLLPVLLLTFVLMLKLRGGSYFPIFLAVGVATLVKVALVMHDHFPSKLFKYILIITFILGVLWALVTLIRRAIRPRKEALLKQHREAYEAFVCPICEFPIRRGPMEFMSWNRRSLKKHPPPPGASQPAGPYTCPCCSTPLFRECSNCGKIRHTLLPACRHCGQSN